jgi:hypothetical protein
MESSRRFGITGRSLRQVRAGLFLQDELHVAPPLRRTQCRRNQMTTSNRIEGSCFCGAVGVAVTGEPVAMGYCHCASCRSWSASPVNGFTLWKPENVSITHGAEHLASYAKTARSHRKWCSKCGGHLMTDHPQWGLVDVFAATIPSLPFKAGVHVNYQDAVLPLRDGLPKLGDFPAELGGTGQAMPE